MFGLAERTSIKAAGEWISSALARQFIVIHFAHIKINCFSGWRFMLLSCLLPFTFHRTNMRLTTLRIQFSGYVVDSRLSRLGSRIALDDGLMPTLRAAVLFIVLASAPAFGQQPSGPLTDLRIMELVRAGVRPDELARIIATAPEISFSLTPAAEQVMMSAGVTEETIKQMAARQNRAASNTPPAASDQGRNVPSAPPVAQRQQPPTQPQPPTPNGFEYQGKGMWDVDLNASATIPHVSGASTTGIVSGSLGYFVSRGSEVGIAASGVFVDGGQDVILGGDFRYYFRSPNPRLLPFIGGAAGVNIAHASGFGTQGNFGALGNAGLRIFVAPHVALQAEYTLLWVHVSGDTFAESSLSQLSVGFATVFGGRGR